MIHEKRITKNQTHQECAHKDLQYTQHKWEHFCLIALKFAGKLTLKGGYEILLGRCTRTHTQLVR